jgi:hypothetical protein
MAWLYLTKELSQSRSSSFSTAAALLLIVDPTCTVCCRSNAPDLLSSLETLTSTLIQHQLALPALPLLALWEHVALHATHNTASVVLARVQRVKALCQLGLLAEAVVVLRGVLQGSSLPGLLLQAPQPILGQDGTGPVQQQHLEAGGKGGSGTADAGDVSGAAAVFNAGKWPAHASNAAMQAYIADMVLPACVAAEYGPWLCGQVAVARAAWLAAVGSVPNCWKSGSYLADASSYSSSSEGKPNGSGNHGANAAASAAGKASAGGAAGESAESKLLEKAAKLLQSVIKASRVALGLPAIAGCSWDTDSSEAAPSAGSATAAKGAHSSGSKGAPAKGSSGKQAKGHGAKGGKADKHHKGAAAAAGAEVAASASAFAEAVDYLVQAQHQQLLVEGLMHLAEVRERNGKVLLCLHQGG